MFTSLSSYQSFLCRLMNISFVILALVVDSYSASVGVERTNIHVLVYLYDESYRTKNLDIRTYLDSYIAPSFTFVC